MVAARVGGGYARVLVWMLHLLAPMLALWLLIAQPRLDGAWEHRPAHFLLVLTVALINVGLAAVINEAARRRADARLFLVAFAFLSAAAFLGLHAAATPGVLLPGRTGGFAYATPVGLTLAAVFAVLSSGQLPDRWSTAVIRWSGALRIGLLLTIAAWALASLAGLPPLAGAPAEDGQGSLEVFAAVAVGLYGAAAWRYYRLYRQRRAVMLLSVVTAYVLLAEAMIAVVFGRNWHASWWEWHLLMAAGFGYVAYSAYVQYQREGAASGLFDGIATEYTLRRIRAEYAAALESLVDAMRRQERGELSPGGMRLITERLADRFELTEGQAAVLDRAAAALATEREQIRRLDALVAVGNQARVLTAEGDLLSGAITHVASGFTRHAIRVGLVSDGRLLFPADLATPTAPCIDDGLAGAAHTALHTGEPVDHEPATLVLPLVVKEHPAGVLVVTHAGDGFADRDRALLTTLANQLSIGLENVRLYRQLDVLFRQYMSPDVATALIADPSQAALGGAVIEVTSLFADLRGFTTFSERSSPPEIVAMLNRYFELATAAVLAESGTIVQFVGDALLALFNAPARQPDHAVRAARAALAICREVEAVVAENRAWPRFRVGINTGEALVGNIGSEALRNFNAMGDAVNVASRLETTAEPGQIVIGGATREALGDRADITPLGDLIVKGREQPVTAYILHALREVKTG